MRVMRVLSLLLLVSTYSLAATPDRITGAIDASQTVELARSLHPKAQAQYDQGPADPSRELSYITMLMAPSASQQKALDQLLAQQQDPKSANYHKWLTPQQYADRFGLSQNDLAKVTTWLSSEGFEILSVGGGRNSVIFSGTVAQVQRAFGTEIHNYKVNGEEHYANSTPIVIPAALNGIVKTVMGLHDFRPRPANGGRRFGGAGIARPAYFDGTFVFPNFLAPGDIATIYDITPLYSASTPIDGTGQKLAVVGQTDIILADINDFRAGFGLSTIPTSGTGACTTNASGIVVSPCNTTNFQYVLLGTDRGSISANDIGEADLDVEWSGAVARNAQIIFINAETSRGVWDALNAAINPPSGPPLAPVVSMSYFEDCEAHATLNLEALFQQGNAEGVTIVNSSGDTGAAACEPNNHSGNPPFSPAPGGLAVQYPASSPSVTAVGGTAISLANDSYPNPSAFWSTTIGANGGTAVCPGGSCVPELAWNDDEELAQYCHAPATGDTFCSQGGTPAVTGWVPLTASATAAQVQSDIWIHIGGGGASNCFYESGTTCLGPGPGPTTGGGLAQPPYQQGLSVPGAPAGVRYVPDVSLLASSSFPGYVFCTPQNPGTTNTSTCNVSVFDAVDTFQSLVGGTSASAPVFAGILTLVNQYLVQNGLPNPGPANPNLYHIARYNQTAFHQLKTGDNMVYCQSGTPAGQPSGVMCPAAVPPATQGVFGYQASNADSATGYNLVNGLGSVDANKLVTAWGELLTASTTSLSPSATNIFAGQSETFTITVTPSTASGVVSLYDNGSTTALGTATVTAGTGTFTTTSLPVGANSIVGNYAGTNASSTSAAVVVTVGQPDFTLSPPVAGAATVLAGQTATYSFTATPTTPSTFTTAVTFSCSFSPADSTLTNSCSATAVQLGITGPQTVTLSIKTAGPNSGTVAAIQHRADKRSPWLPLALPIAGVVMVGLVGRRMSKHLAVGALCLLLALIGLMVACGGGSSAPPPPVISVSVTPNATVNLYANETGNKWAANLTQQKFSATVNNDTNQTVTWAVTGGSANGSIDATGLYTAPATVPSPALVTVTATSPDATQPGTGQINIKTPTKLGMYTVMVTAAEGGTSHSQPVTLTVQ